MNSDLSSFAALAPAYPELLLAVGAVVLLLAGVFWSRERSTALSFFAARLSRLARAQPADCRNHCVPRNNRR